MLALQALTIFVIATVIGLGSAWLAIDREFAFETVETGGWTAWPRAGEAGSDPYIRAAIATSGQLPLNVAEGIAFTARRDSEGQPIDASCEYVVAGRMPAARWWTITAYREANFGLMDNVAQRFGFDSTEALRRADGSVEIVLGPAARPGNWLPTDPDSGQLRLILRLYDTPLSIGGAVADAELPSIHRRSCP